MIYIALPVLDEIVNLPGFMAALRAQTIREFRLSVCVNQPDNWWSLPGKNQICENNQVAIEYLRSLQDDRITVIDKSSKGRGWEGKNHGIGWARKILMDAISQAASPEDIIVSMDADTEYSPAYLDSLLGNFKANPGALAISVPYYHKLTGDEKIDRAMLRYELYMRIYAINLWRIRSPYCFTALGSAIALTVKAYRHIGGMTPKLSGEDFYFLQKLVKSGPVIHYNREVIYPAARLSDRVYFGTGPALIKGLEGDWDSYPIYSIKWFDDIRKLYEGFPVLFDESLSTPLDDFLADKFGHLPWEELRANYKSAKQFTRACHVKFDGLRILQYLKERQRVELLEDEENMREFLKVIQEEFDHKEDKWAREFSFAAEIPVLNHLRDYLFEVEMHYRKQGV